LGQCKEVGPFQGWIGTIGLKTEKALYIVKNRHGPKLEQINITNIDCKKEL